MSNSFNNLGICENLTEALKKQGIYHPTEVQIKGIPSLLENKDIIAQSQTGSGKTLAYLLPIFQRIQTTKKEMQSIILTPTHELAIQIDGQIKLLSQNSSLSVTSATIIGEANITRQIEKLKEKPHIITGTPGRILDLIKKRKISAHTINFIVIDEADRLLDQNSLNTVKDIIKTTMKHRQLMVFSATIHENTLNISKELMKDPEIIKIKEEKQVNTNITHSYLISEQRDKIQLLRKLVASIRPKKSIVFINKMEQIEITTAKLQYHHINAYAIYGNSSKEERKKALEGFKNGKYQLLIASDIAARGLDIRDVTHIFNLDLPEDPKEYLHRVGRTGRHGNKGTAISIVTPKERISLKKYEKEFNIKIEEKQIFKGNILTPRKNNSPKKAYPSL